MQNVPLHKKTNNLGFRPGPTQTDLYKYRRWLEVGNFEFRKNRSETKCADQLRSNCKADLSLFSHKQNVGFIKMYAKYDRQYTLSDNFVNIIALTRQYNHTIYSYYVLVLILNYTASSGPRKVVF